MNVPEANFCWTVRDHAVRTSGERIFPRLLKPILARVSGETTRPLLDADILCPTSGGIVRFLRASDNFLRVSCDRTCPRLLAEILARVSGEGGFLFDPRLLSATRCILYPRSTLCRRSSHHCSRSRNAAYSGFSSTSKTKLLGPCLFQAFCNFILQCCPPHKSLKCACLRALPQLAEPTYTLLLTRLRIWYMVGPVSLNSMCKV